jgi:hypothetical protein
VPFVETGDTTVSITRATYGAAGDKLWVYAGSGDGSAVLTATADYGAGPVPLGEILYNVTKKEYRALFTGIISKPASVTVTNASGVSDTRPVPYTAP